MTNNGVHDEEIVPALSDEQLAKLSPPQLLATRAAIDARLDQVRAAFVDQCAALGLSVVDGNGKKPRRKSKTHHEA